MTAKEIVESIEPDDDDGWWESGTGEAFEDAAGEMLSLGMDDEHVAGILDSLRCAMAGEYGD